MEETICINKRIITPNKRYSRVVRKSAQIEDGYSQYLCFNIIIGSNNLIPQKEYSDHQKQNHDLIKSLHDSGMGYRKIAQYLNERGFTAEEGHIWKSPNVYSVIKRYSERLERLKFRRKKYPVVRGKIWMEFTK